MKKVKNNSKIFAVILVILACISFIAGIDILMKGSEEWSKGFILIVTGALWSACAILITKQKVPDKQEQNHEKITVFITVRRENNNVDVLID